MPAFLFQDVPRRRCFMRQGSMVGTSNVVQGAIRMLRAASSGDELNIYFAKLIGTGVIPSSTRPITQSCMLDMAPWSACSPRLTAPSSGAPARAAQQQQQQSGCCQVGASAGSLPRRGQD